MTISDAERNLHFLRFASNWDVWWMLKLICDALLLKSDWHAALEGSCIAVPVCPCNSAAPLFTESIVGSPNTWLFLKKSAIAWNSDVRSRSEVDGNSPTEIGMFATN